MAIDTAAKRYSILNFGDGRTPYLLPIPDGTIGAPDRAHLLDLYAGITLDTGAAPPVIGPCDVVSFSVYTIELDTTADYTIEPFAVYSVIDEQDCD